LSSLRRAIPNQQKSTMSFRIVYSSRTL
jgi:hypothetical protein